MCNIFAEFVCDDILRRCEEHEIYKNHDGRDLLGFKCTYNLFKFVKGVLFCRRYFFYYLTFVHRGNTVNCLSYVHVIKLDLLKQENFEDNKVFKFKLTFNFKPFVVKSNLIDNVMISK